VGHNPPQGVSNMVRRRVDRLVVDLHDSPAREHILGVILTGSAARGEEAYASGRLVSDIDVMVVTASESLSLGREIATVIRRHAEAGIEGSRVSLRPLRSYLSVAFFEAYACGVVMYGEPHLLDTIALKDPSRIPLWEALRLLFNRVFEHLKVLRGASSVTHCVAKTYEALAEAYLISGGLYRPSFCERAIVVAANDRVVPAAIRAGHDWSYRYRIDSSVGNAPSLASAAVALARTVDDFVRVYVPGTADTRSGLSGLRRQMCHPRQRAYWFARAVAEGRPDMRHLLSDPILNVWNAGWAAFVGQARQQNDLNRLLADWAACPQIYMRVRPS
jgi:predicted nucleotidyltransferase